MKRDLMALLIAASTVAACASIQEQQTDTGWDTGIDTLWDTMADTAIDTLADTLVDPLDDPLLDTLTDTAVDSAFDTGAEPDVAPDASALCGNGAVDGTEECDDGGVAPGDGCSASCTFEYCGDGTTGDLLYSTFGFESGGFDLWSWTLGGTYAFDISTAQVHTGTTSIGSTNAARTSTTASVTMTEDCDGEICFWWAGESESCCDDFRFRVDGTLIEEWQGDHRTWSEYCHTVTPGVHDFEWQYYKDSSIDTGWDAYYVDDITLYNVFTEQCDDGGTVGGDGCSENCTTEICGNGILDVGEECDDGGVAPGDGCHPDCSLPICGDSDIGWSKPFEGFESNGLMQLPWSTGTGNSAWSVQTGAANVHTGTHFMRSENRIISSTTAWIEVDLTVVEDGPICFWYRGESESCCDDFRFRIDGTLIHEDQGVVDPYQEFCTDVTTGTHTFRWEYYKDSSINTGADRFTVDHITFPMIAEQCDDGGSAIGDGCNSNCLTE